MEFIIGIAVGILLGAILFHRRPVGDLRVDRSDPTENPSLFLELERDVWFVSRKKKITLRVRNQDFLPTGKKPRSAPK